MDLGLPFRLSNSACVFTRVASGQISQVKMVSPCSFTWTISSSWQSQWHPFCSESQRPFKSLINHEKSHQNPSHRVDFLGVSLDLKKGVAISKISRCRSWVEAHLFLWSLGLIGQSSGRTAVLEVSRYHPWMLSAGCSHSNVPPQGTKHITKQTNNANA